MTNYQKIATLIFRIVGVLVMIAGIIFWVSAAFVARSFPGTGLIFFLGFLPYVAAGIVLFVVSRALAKWVCFDFDKFDEQK